ncbi:hypothetical protein ISCGN_001408 [Ixodes scapularis]
MARNRRAVVAETTAVEAAQRKCQRAEQLRLLMCAGLYTLLKKNRKPLSSYVLSLPRQKYVPHCTILHRCGPDTGCCSTEEEHCQAKTVQAVPLQFLLVQLNADGQSRYEPATLAFDNHTECECRLKNEPIR